MYKLLSPLFTVAIIVIITAGSAMAQKPKAVTIAFYNVENLFDTLNDPSINDEDFLPQGKLNWNKTRFDIKLNRIAKVVNEIEETNKPDIVGLCEVENKAVLTDLVNLKSMDRFGIVHFDSPDERGIDVALLYRKKIVKVFLKTLGLNSFLALKISWIKTTIRNEPHTFSMIEFRNN
jgi:predicted extracellular nuclease